MEGLDGQAEEVMLYRAGAGEPSRVSERGFVTCEYVPKTENH